MFLSAFRGSLRRSSAATTALLLVVLALCLLSNVCVPAAAATEGPRMSPVVQCREDFHNVCGKSDSARELWGCMMRNTDKIENSVCKDYVLGFRACTRDAEKKSSCVNPAADYATSVRRCLRTLPDSSISAECRNSRFYFPIAEVRNANWQKPSGTEGSS